MRYILNNFFILLFFISNPVYAESFYKKFTIKVSGLKIGELIWVLEINNKPLVSKDFNHNSHSSIFDVTQTQVIKGKFSRVLSWYDNEWGFSNRMCDTAIQISKLI